VTLAFLGLTIADAAASLVGDTCTLPQIPVLNRIDDPFLWKPAVLPENLLGCASGWLRDPWARGCPAKDAEPTITSSTGDVPLPEKPAVPESRTPDERPPLLMAPEVRQGMARWECGEPLK
jgi:hypothetical protein